MKPEEIPVWSLSLPVRVRNALANAGVKTAADLAKITPAEMLRAQNFGVGSLNVLRQALAIQGLHLAEDSVGMALVENECSGKAGRRIVHDGFIACRVGTKLVALLEAKAEAREMSVSEYIRDLLRRDLLGD